MRLRASEAKQAMSILKDKNLGTAPYYTSMSEINEITAYT